MAFSGGLDSSVVASCAKRHAGVLACTGFAKGSADDVKARGAAGAMGIRFEAIEITKEKAERAMAEISLPFTPTLMDRSLWCLYSSVAKLAHDSGAKVMLLGQLADELFGGYSKYDEALTRGGDRAARGMMSADYHEYAARGRLRDFRACSPWVEPRLPFESRRLEELAASLPTSFLIRGGVRKAVLRRAAILLGVPEEAATAAKKAAQFSSGVQKLVVSLRF